MFGEADWSMLYSTESETYAAHLASLVGSFNVRNLPPDEDTALYRSNLVMELASLLRSHPRRNRLSQLVDLSNQHRYNNGIFTSIFLILYL